MKDISITFGYLFDGRLFIYSIHMYTLEVNHHLKKTHWFELDNDKPLQYLKKSIGSFGFPEYIHIHINYNPI